MTTNSQSPAPKFDPVGHCIYCGAKGPRTPLHIEHIVPECLGGYAELPQASCPDCEKVTSYLEGVCGRQLFNHTRVHLGLLGKRPKTRPKKIPVRFVREGKMWTEDVPPTHHFVLLVMPIFARPRILLGIEPSRQSHQIDWHLTWDKERADRSRGGIGEIEVDVKVNEPAFCRMLAKIAHSFSYSYFGRAFYAQSHLLPDLILGRNLNASYLVGGALEPLLIPDQTNLASGYDHRLALRFEHHQGVKWLICRIQLFANYNTPAYDVAVCAAQDLVKLG